MKVLVLHGPNLNLQGKREPETYGHETLDEINGLVSSVAAGHGVEVTIRQSNHEGELIDLAHGAIGRFDALIVNAGGYSHTSVALRDALAATGLPVVEVHLSNLARREAFRHRSLVAEIAVGTIQGFGGRGYALALEALVHLPS